MNDDRSWRNRGRTARLLSGTDEAATASTERAERLVAGLIDGGRCRTGCLTAAAPPRPGVTDGSASIRGIDRLVPRGCRAVVAGTSAATPSLRGPSTAPTPAPPSLKSCGM